MIVADRTLNARQAAERFAATHWEGPRRVGLWEPVSGLGSLVARFRLIGGRQWYTVIEHAAGWLIVAEGQ